MKLEEWQKRNKYIPLTYLECKANKPLIIKLNDQWNFVVQLQGALEFATILDVKDTIVQNIIYWAKKRPRKEETKHEKNKNYMTAVMSFIGVLYDLSKGQYKKKEKKYREFFYPWGLQNIDKLIEIWQRVLEYNSRLEKKNVVPAELQPYTNTRPLDKWRGFCSRRIDIKTKTFLECLHEDEEQTTQAIAEHKETKKRNSKDNSRPFQAPRLA